MFQDIENIFRAVSPYALWIGIPLTLLSFYFAFMTIIAPRYSDWGEWTWKRWLIYLGLWLFTEILGVVLILGYAFALL